MVPGQVQLFVTHKLCVLLVDAPSLAEIVKPLTELTHGNAVWSWSSQHDKAFKTAKSLIANATMLKFFEQAVCVTSGCQ